jgi:hypothetical protein
MTFVNPFSCEKEDPFLADICRLASGIDVTSIYAWQSLLFRGKFITDMIRRYFSLNAFFLRDVHHRVNFFN